MSVRFTGQNATVPGVATIEQVLATILRLARSTVSLTADNQVVDAAGLSYIALSSDNGTASNRDFVLTQGVSGQILVLEWVGTNAGQIADDAANDDAGNVRLSAAWVPTQYDILVLLCNGTDWIEVARSAN